MMTPTKAKAKGRSASVAGVRSHHGQGSPARAQGAVPESETHRKGRGGLTARSNAHTIDAMSDHQDLFFQFIGRGGARCPICSYSLDGLREPRCPECGEPLGLAVRGESMRRGAWIVGLIAWSAGFGLYGIFVPLALVMSGGPPARLWSFYLGTVITWPALAVWLLIARRFRLWSPRTRQLLAEGSVAFMTLLLMGTVYQLR